MEFEPSDYNWSDCNDGFSEERAARYHIVRQGILDAVALLLKEHASDHNASAEVPEGVFTVGVTGDARIYAPIVELSYTAFPGHDHLVMISNAITNTLPVSRVMYVVRRRDPFWNDLLK